MLKSNSLYHRLRVAYHKRFSDRRRYMRKQLRVKVTEKVSGVFEHFNSLNISVGGMFLKSERPFAVGSRLSVNFTLPGMSKQIEADAMVVRTCPPGNPRGLCPGMGIQFTRMDPEDRKTIEQFIEDSGVY